MSDTRSGVSAPLSASLDVARAISAVYVVLHHVANARGWSQGVGWFLRFGQEAVLVFFLLSGFVIFANERRRALSPKGYYWRRFRRLYPALLVAMLVSTLIAIDNGDVARRFSWGTLIATLASLQDVSFLKPGTIADPYLGNQPLWSLSYEAAFYLVFPLVLRPWKRRPQRVNAIVGFGCCASYVAFVVWPNHFALVAAYYLVWWCGAMAADAYLRGGSDFRAFLPSLGWLALLCAVAAVATAVIGYKGPGFYPFLPMRHFAAALVLLVAFAGPFGTMLARWCVPLRRPAAAVASISYGLYVLHFPILVDWQRTRSLVGLAVGVLILIAAAYLADHRLNVLLPRAPRD